MKKEDFFEVLGELDGKIVKEAKAYMKKRTNWKVWGSMVACLAVVLSIGAFALNSRQNGNTVSESGVADVALMVYVNNTLYKQSGDQQGYPELKDEFVYLGQILSDVTNNQSGDTDGVPKENFQANHPIVGCEVYQYGENIVVKINDAYWLYMKYGNTEVNWNELSDEEKEQLDPTYKK